MTEIEFKKKLIADLEDLYDYLREERKLHPDKIIFENYDCVLSNAWFAIRDTLPRVLTVEEVKNKTNSVVFLESLDSYNGYWSRYCRLNFYWTQTNRVDISYFATDDEDELDLASYNKTWRIWNTEPTAEQMKEVPWDCD